MKFIISLVFIVTSVFSLEVEKLAWPKGETFLTFLEKNNIHQNLYFNLEKEDKELCSEIRAGIEYYVSHNHDGSLNQVLIPISEEIQLHVYKDDEEYKFTITPVEFKETTQTVAIPIKYSPYQDILEHTSNQLLANEFIRAYSKSVNFRHMQKGNFVIIKYKQRVRMGQYFGVPQIISAMTQVRKKEFFIFKNENDGRFYNEKAKSLTSYFFKTPLTYSRISSRFTYKRWHPVLKRYRAHLGIDYAAPRGRHIYAAGDGRITFRGRKGGYGKVIEIKHKNGYKTLYAHQSKFRGGLKRGSRVRKGQHIGYVGTTGVSTGPHLHFGLYKNGRAVNPAKIIRVTTKKLSGKARKKFIRHTKSLSKELLDKMKDTNAQPFNLEPIDMKTIVEA